MFLIDICFFLYFALMIAYQNLVGRREHNSLNFRADTRTVKGTGVGMAVLALVGVCDQRTSEQAVGQSRELVWEGLYLHW